MSVYFVEQEGERKLDSCLQKWEVKRSELTEGELEEREEERLRGRGSGREKTKEGGRERELNEVYYLDILDLKIK